MKRSRSGTRSRTGKRSPRQALGLLLAVLAVLAFVASFVFGLGRGANPRPRPAATDSTASPVVPDSRVRVQVLNGSDKPGLARLATEQLRAAGYDVVGLGNARSSVTSSLVLDRVGNRVMAEGVAQALGITRVETRPDTSLYLEVTVVLGPEWRARQLPTQR